MANGVIELYTDGACSGNPGPGGWACILVWNGVERGLSGYNINTTNNAMELQAVVAGLNLLKGPSEVFLYSDSKYVVDSIDKGWLKRWVENGEVSNRGGTRPNSELWFELWNLLNIHKVRVLWVKGHANNKYNNMCDKMAVKQRDVALQFVRLL